MNSYPGGCLLSYAMDWFWGFKIIGYDFNMNNKY